jgi:hypothetical protein
MLPPPSGKAASVKPREEGQAPFRDLEPAVAVIGMGAWHPPGRNVREF